MPFSVFFFPVNIWKVPVNIVAKVPVNILLLPVNFSKKNCPWTQKSAREHRKSARESQSAREHFKRKCPWTHEKVPVNAQFVLFSVLLGKMCPWTAKCVREHFDTNLPVNYQKCPWKRPKIHTWTHAPIREFSSKCARERKNLPVNICEKWRFTHTFEVHGEKKHCFQLRWFQLG